MVDPPFSLFEPMAKETPVIVEVPHAGTAVPVDQLATMVVPVRAVGRDADLYVDELYADTPAEGATLLVSRVSRFVVDLNRAEGDADAEAVVGGRIAKLPRGVIWRLSSEHEPVLERTLTRDEFEQRMNSVYRPYHRALAETIERKRARFGYAIVLAAHSMPSVGRLAHGEAGPPRADVVPGTQGRTTASEAIIACVDAHVREHGLTIAHDDPYRGGYTTQHYGRPHRGVHAVQVELSRRLYMDEQSLQRDVTRFEWLRTWCRQLVARLGKTAVG
jgi:N-formylglutamate deformylase